ncbi:MAG: hypothetical protein AAGF93_22900 [Cyanobacteria bacterium P01_H01_bin.105]
MKNLVTKLIVAAFLSLTIASGGAAIYLATQPTLTEQQDRLFDSALIVWTTCTTLMPTLLTSRSAQD